MLARNDLLVEITEKLTYVMPDWDEIARIFSDNSDRYPKKNTKQQRILTGYLGELHLRVSLEKSCEGLEERVAFNPIKEGDSTKNYRFKFSCGQLYAVNKSNRRYHSEIDQIVLVDGMPVLFEIKITSSSKHRGGSRGISCYMREERINYVIKPIKELFNSNCGYVFVVSRNKIKPTSPVQQNFERMGAIIVPLYTDGNGFENDALTAKFRYGL